MFFSSHAFSTTKTPAATRSERDLPPARYTGPIADPSASAVEGERVEGRKLEQDIFLLRTSGDFLFLALLVQAFYKGL